MLMGGVTRGERGALKERVEDEVEVDESADLLRFGVCFLLSLCSSSFPSYVLVVVFETNHFLSSPWRFFTHSLAWDLNQPFI